MYNLKKSLFVVKIYLLTACIFLLFGSVASSFLDYPLIHGLVLFFFVLIPGFFNAFSVYYINRYLPSTSCIWRERISLVLFIIASIFLIVSFFFEKYIFQIWYVSIALVLLSMWVISWHFIVYLYKKKSLEKISSFIVFSFVCIHGFLLLIIPSVFAVLLFYKMNMEDIFWTILHPINYAFIILLIGIIADHIFEKKNRFTLYLHYIIVLLLLFLGLCSYLFYILQNKNPFGSEAYISLTMISAIPIFFLLIYWIIALWKNNIQLRVSTCFSLMCMSLFIFGGLMDIFFIHYHLPICLGDTYFTVAHFHLILGVCVAMAWLSCIYQNWSNIFYRFDDKKFENKFYKIHFLITFISVYIIFTLMYYVGLIGIPKLYFASIEKANNSIPFYAYMIIGISAIAWIMQITFIVYLLSQTLKSYSSQKEI